MLFHAFQLKADKLFTLKQMETTGMYSKEISRQLHGLRDNDKKTSGLFVSYKRDSVYTGKLSIKAQINMISPIFYLSEPQGKWQRRQLIEAHLQRSKTIKRENIKGG